MVWEEGSREAPSYPDQSSFHNTATNTATNEDSQAGNQYVNPEVESTYNTSRFGESERAGFSAPAVSRCPGRSSVVRKSLARKALGPKLFVGRKARVARMRFTDFHKTSTNLSPEWRVYQIIGSGATAVTTLMTGPL